MKRLSFLFAVVVFPFVLKAAPLERDLSQGLAYLRFHSLPGDLPTKPVGRAAACVVDLRYAEVEGEGANNFLTWLKARAAPKTPMLVLANADTSPALLRVLAAQDAASGVMVIGIPAKGFRPDVPVKSSPEEERRAYDALEKGASVVSLLTDNPEKVRNDEASLSKDRLAEASAEAADDVLTGKPPAPPIDAALQRAVHLHRSLVALKKI